MTKTPDTYNDRTSILFDREFPSYIADGEIVMFSRAGSSALCMTKKEYELERKRILSTPLP